MYGNSVEEAKKLYKYICEKDGISSLKIKSDPSLTVDMMGESNGFLPVWMIKAEELWSILYDDKMWSVSYKVDSDSVCGLSVSDDLSNGGFLEREGGGEGFPVSLRFLLGRLALFEIIGVNNKLAFIKEETRIYYNYNEDNDTIELLDRSSLQRLSYVSIMGIMSNALDAVRKKVPVADYDSYISEKRDSVFDKNRGRNDINDNLAQSPN